MTTGTETTKRGRGRPRLYANPEAAAAARAARREDKAIRQRIAAADAEAAAQPTIEILLVTTKQAAQALQVSERTIANLVSDGRLSDIKILGTRRIALDEIKRLATTGTN